MKIDPRFEAACRKERESKQEWVGQITNVIDMLKEDLPKMTLGELIATHTSINRLRK